MSYKTAWYASEHPWNHEAMAKTTNKQRRSVAPTALRNNFFCQLCIYVVADATLCCFAHSLFPVKSKLFLLPLEFYNNFACVICWCRREIVDRRTVVATTLLTVVSRAVKDGKDTNETGVRCLANDKTGESSKKWSPKWWKLHIDTASCVFFVLPLLFYSR